MLKAHVVDGYYPFGSLFSASSEPHLTNLLGVSFTMTQSDPGDIVHGVQVMGINYTVGNGNRVQFIDKLLPVK